MNIQAPTPPKGTPS